MDQYRASKDVIESFLSDLKTLLNSKSFNPEKDFLLGGKRERLKNTKTLLELDMNKNDVIEILKELEVSNYYQSVPDNKNKKMPDFHVFFISILGKEIYIKARIQQINNVLCISFHFAEYSHGKMPY